MQGSEAPPKADSTMSPYHAFPCRAVSPPAPLSSLRRLRAAGWGQTLAALRPAARAAQQEMHSKPHWCWRGAAPPEARLRAKRDMCTVPSHVFPPSLAQPCICRVCSSLDMPPMTSCCTLQLCFLEFFLCHAAKDSLPAYKLPFAPLFILLSHCVATHFTSVQGVIRLSWFQ